MRQKTMSITLLLKLCFAVSYNKYVNEVSLDFEFSQNIDKQCFART
jgi:hypothetical protein